MTEPKNPHPKVVPSIRRPQEFIESGAPPIDTVSVCCPECVYAPRVTGECPSHGVFGLCPEDGVLYEEAEDDDLGKLSTCGVCGDTIRQEPQVTTGWTHVARRPGRTSHAAEPDDSAVSGPGENDLDAQIDRLHGPGAAAALDEAIADGSIFGEEGGSSSSR